MPPRTGRRQASVFSCDEIGVEQLHSLKEKFAGGDLTEVEFVRLFRETIDSTLSETQLTDLFQKIDANSDGTVSWDEFTNYMFLSGSDNAISNLSDDMSCRYITTQPDKVVDVVEAGGGDSSAVRPANNHKDIITRIVPLDKPHLYVTASRDGSVRTWNSNTLAYQTTIATGRNWITDCSYMKRSNRLAVSSMNRTLAFYDMSTGQPVGDLSEYSKKQCIPLCLEYVEKPSDEKEALVIGDDTGGITVMTTSNQWSNCDGRPGAHQLETHGFSTRAKYKKHTDWITRVKWVHDMRAIVATSLDTNISIIDVERMVAKFEYSKHKKGVFDLVWSSTSRLIASCGMERDISIWNPYSSQRAVATLRGHTASVLHLACDDDNFQIVSVSSDNIFKVWDIRNHRCLQTFADRFKSTGGADNRISSLLFDPKVPGLISATTHLARWPLKMISSEEAELITKKAPCISCYNSVFNQVLTAEMSEEGVVKTWSAETGEEVCSFNNAHGSSPVTAMSFDCAGRRLITGSHDGAQVKMWNFSNGALVKQFLKEEKKATEPHVSPFSVPPPRPPRVRDIVVLPDAFDAEKLLDGSSSKLPSPTRTTLKASNPDTTTTPHPPSTPSTSSQHHHHHQRYQQSEVTCILDIERNVRVGMGEYICQRFVVSVGWDRRIYIWLDSNDEDEPLPMWIIAATDTSKCHTDDILSVVYIPPATLATSGLDGKILLWNLNSGEFMSQLHQSDGAIECMMYCNKLELLMAAGDEGKLITLDRVSSVKTEIPLEHPTGESVVVMACDRCGDNVITGDSAGYIRTWGLSVSLKDKGMYFEHGCQWRVGGGRILSLNFIENTRQIDLFVLVSSGNGEVSLWTLDSVQVGVFGRHKYWHLGKPSTYSASAPQANAHAGKHHKHFIPSRSIAAALTHTQHMESQLAEDSMPKPGEVWISRSAHHHSHRNSVDLMSSQVASTVGKIVTTLLLSASGDEANLLIRKASMSMARDSTSDIADIITVIKVSKGEILAWDGIAQQIKQKTLKLEEFVRDNMWTKDSHFSQCIGRCFMSTHENTPYKCLYVAIKSVHMRNTSEGAFAFVDTEGSRHRTQMLDSAVTTHSKLKSVARTLISASTRLGQKATHNAALRTMTAKKHLDKDMKGIAELVPTSGHNGQLPQTVSGKTTTTGIKDAEKILGLAKPSFVCSTLPLLRPKEKHAMGGNPPKRSNMRSKLDPNADFRRVHDPQTIPKTAKEVLEQRHRQFDAVGLQ
ncbi:hypothetical protein H310_00586 [Aphanomyces invadans]|uniref:EF-hand domain-containing protein n=1 Tax=Aphanomyces invadans TaxID=157072 RepID=A0A024UUN4_9STRA|nr:hypothetical protein H310_00586 [Aphanomyces invadans]ETW10231.1 hypothetical protein H310_00586 [Aphanomyces invadans]|eukprot:XP_008861642.1 hypothetical protein H310_00586 [Aphanomyces invadans]